MKHEIHSKLSRLLLCPLFSEEVIERDGKLKTENPHTPELDRKRIQEESLQTTRMRLVTQMGREG